jgi:hypothetical protein
MSSHPRVRFSLRLLLTISLVGMASATVFAANNPVPFIDLPPVPSVAVPGGAGFTLTVNGAGFVNGSVVNWNGSPRATTFVSAGRVTAAILASDIATANTASITVSNPTPDGGTSNVSYFEVTTPASTVVVSGLPLPAFPQGIYSAIAADLNNDGKLDVILFSRTFIANQGYVYQAASALGNGDGTFQSPTPVTGPDLVASDVALGDFNGDGKLDIALVSGSDAISIFLGNGDGTFQAPILVGSQPNSAYDQLVLGDFNQDGKLDIIAENCSSPCLMTVLLGNGDGTFQPPVNSSVGWGNDPLTLGDFNGDGVIDLLTCVGGDVFDEASCLVMLGNGDATFQPGISSLSATGLTLGVSAGDVNGDGKLDLLISSELMSLNFYAAVQLGDGNGSFSAPVGQNIGPIPVFPPADLNGDGNLDLVENQCCGIGLDTLSVALGNGDGTFSFAPLTTTTGQSLTALVQGDFNGDGQMDILAEGVGNNSGSAWMFLQGASLPVASLSLSSLSFSSQTVGTTSQAQIITLTNVGTATLTLSALTITGANASEFGQGGTCTGSLAAGATCQISVTFAPASGGTKSANLNILHSGSGGSTVSLSGMGNTTLPTVILSPPSVNFAPQAVGTHSSQPALIGSPGPGTVTRPIVAVTGANAGDFSANSCSSELLPGATCQITVTFTPAAIGTRSASLNFSDNAVGSPQKIALVGSGPDFSTSSPTPASLTVAAGQPANYTFEILPLGGFSQTVTLTCSGAPAGAKCTVPGAVMLSSGMTVAVRVTTTAGTAAMKQGPLSSSGRWLACGLFGLPLIVSLAGVCVRRRRVHIYRWTFLLSMTAAMALWPACGGGSGGGDNGSGTPVGTYPLTVRGTFTSAGTTLIHDTTLTLVVE